MPDRLGKYELRGTLGKGAMGVVYDAWDTVLERRVAVKTIRLPDEADEEQTEGYARFKREAQAAGRLSHPGIVGVYDYGDADGVAYIAMELVEGQSLKAMLDAEHRLAPDAAVRVMHALLDALAYSHARGVIHRDIKPTNILVTSSGALKITDFGIARIESSSMTQMGTVMGTPAYMSPEQFMGQTVDQRTDIYSAGVLLFQLLTGERPFEGGLTAIMHKVLHTAPPKPSDLSVTAPAAFDAVVARAMARRPEDRFDSAAAFSAALTAALAGGPAVLAGGPAEDGTVLARRVPAPPAPPAPPPRPVARAPAASVARSPAARRIPVALLGGSGLVVLAALGIGTFILLSPANPSSSTRLASPEPQPLPVYDPPPSPPEPSPIPTPVMQPVPLPALHPTPPPLPVSLPAPASPAGPAAALRTIACTLLDTRPDPTGNLFVSGMAGTGAPKAAAMAAAAAPGARATALHWNVTELDSRYCPVLDTLRTIRNAQPPSQDFGLSLRSGSASLHIGNSLAPIVAGPNFLSYLQLVYIQNGDVPLAMQMFPLPGSPIRGTQPGEQFSLGVNWKIYPPLGTDILIAIVSSEPFPVSLKDETAANYMGMLRENTARFARAGATVLVRAIPVQIVR